MKMEMEAYSLQLLPASEGDDEDISQNKSEYFIVFKMMGDNIIFGFIISYL